jgi:hypothetical protein
MYRIAILGALILSTGAADTRAAREARDLDKALAGRVAGAPVHCLDVSRAGGPQIIGDRTLIYRDIGRRIWRNELPDRCPALTGDVIIVSEVHGSQLCRGDLFSTVIRGSSIPGPRCQLGDFVPYEKPKP